MRLYQLTTMVALVRLVARMTMMTERTLMSTMTLMTLRNPEMSVEADGSKEHIDESFTSSSSRSER